MSFLYPWVLLGLLVPVLWILVRWRRRQRLEAAIAYPTVDELPASRGLRARARVVLVVLRALTLALLVAALARRARC